MKKQGQNETKDILDETNGTNLGDRNTKVLRAIHIYV